MRVNFTFEIFYRFSIMLGEDFLDELVKIYDFLSIMWNIKIYYNNIK